MFDKLYDMCGSAVDACGPALETWTREYNRGYNERQIARGAKAAFEEAQHAAEELAKSKMADDLRKTAHNAVEIVKDLTGNGRTASA